MNHNDHVIFILNAILSYLNFVLCLFSILFLSYNINLHMGEHKESSSNELK